MDLAQQFMVGRVTIQCLHVIKRLPLRLNQNTSDNLFPSHRLRLQTVRHNVVDILDEYDVGVQVIEVLDEGTVASWPEKQAPIVIPERRVVGVDRYGIGTRLLLGELYVIFYSKLLFIVSRFLLHPFLKQVKVLMRHGEVHMGYPSHSSVKRSLHQMLLHRRASTVIIGM